MSTTTKFRTKCSHLNNADEDGHEVLVVKKFSISEYVATATKIVAAMVESL